MPGLEALSDEELDALERGDMSALSDQALNVVESYAMQDAPSEERRGGLGDAFRGMAQPYRALAGAVRGNVEAGAQLGASEQGPAAAAGIAAGMMTAGMGAVPAALAVGGASGAAEAVRQGASPTEDINPPKIVRRGVENALADLGVSASMGALRSALPVVSQVFAKIPAESIKRAIEKPAILVLKGDAKLATDKAGVKALEEVQTAIEAARRKSGVRVDGALKGLELKTKGARVIDYSSVVNEGMDELAKRGGFDETTGALLKKEQGMVGKFIDALPPDGKIGVREAVNLRRQLDDMVTYKSGGVQKVSSEAGEAIARRMATALRRSLDAAADQFQYKALKEANAKHTRMATLYDEMGEIFKTPSDSTFAKSNRFNLAASKFYQGGLPKEVLLEAGRAIPYGSSAVERLLDAAAAKSFTEIPSTAPSNMLFNFFRLIGAPRATGAGIKAMQSGEGAIRAGAIGAVNLGDAVIAGE